MTKEEILEKHTEQTFIDNINGGSTLRTVVYYEKAMQEYADQETQRLKDELEIVENYNDMLIRELSELKEKHKRDVVGFAEYISGLCISNYKSGGSWYLNGGKIVTTDKLLEQYYNETHKTK